MIVKLQRPLSPPAGPWLVYNEARTLYLTIPDAKLPTQVKNAMRERLKGFFNVTIPQSGDLIWGQPVTDPGW